MAVASRRPVVCLGRGGPLSMAGRALHTSRHQPEGKRPQPRQREAAAVALRHAGLPLACRRLQRELAVLQQQQMQYWQI